VTATPTPEPTAEPRPEEVAAAVLAALLAAGPAQATADQHQEFPDGPASVWAGPGHGARTVRAVHVPSPHAWRTSFWPR
jgi:hypothetical protein